MPLDEGQRKRVNDYPLTIQRVFLDAYPDEVEALAKKHGYQLSDEDRERLRALSPPPFYARTA